MNTPLASLILRPLALSTVGARQLRALAFDAHSHDAYRTQAKESKDRPDWLDSDYLGNKIPEPYDLADGARVVPLQGPITRNLGLMGMFYGMADTDRFVAQIKSASEDSRVSKIVIHAQTPGGDAVGCLEAARAVQEAGKKKPVYAFCDDVCASAGYFIASAARSIFVTSSCIIGSIGTYSVLTDESEFWKRMGVEFLVLRSGKFKGAGIDGFTSEQIDEMQKMVDSFGEQFRAFVDESRNGDVKRDAMEGQVWLGSEAVKCGIADYLVDSFEMASSRLAKMNDIVSETQIRVDHVKK